MTAKKTGFVTPVVEMFRGRIRAIAAGFPASSGLNQLRGERVLRFLSAHLMAN